MVSALIIIVLVLLFATLRQQALMVERESSLNGCHIASEKTAFCKEKSGVDFFQKVNAFFQKVNAKFSKVVLLFFCR